MKQVNIGSWWGNLLLSIGQISQAVSLLTLIFAAIAAYPTIKIWLFDFGIDLKFWQFVIGVVTTAFIGVAFAWIFGLASFFSTWNKQFWQHDNPIRKELEEIHKEIRELKGQNDSKASL